MSTRRLYCTYFDSQYLARGLAMLRSVRRWDPSASILVLALDELCEKAVRAAFDNQVEVLPQRELLETDRDLASVGERRAGWPYYATHKPVFLLSVLLAEAPGTTVIYIDADTWFYSSPEPMLAELGEASIGLSPHRFSPRNGDLVKFGIYNAGCLYFRVDQTAIDCVAFWRAECLDWCAEEATADGRFMNQGYLNRWPARYSGVHLIGHPGVNVAPWNVNDHRVDQIGDEVLVDGQPLIFYHFSSMHCDRDGNWYSLANYFRRQFEVVVEAIYKPYAAAVEREHAYLREIFGLERGGSVREVTIGPEAVQVYSTGA
jgi:hypothetical protein